MSNVPYFKAKEIAHRAWQIEYNFTDREHVYCYLVEGSEAALVIDTMYGYGNLKAFCETLTDKPLRLVNTHFHFDHTAGNFDFDRCYMHHADIAAFYDSRVSTPEQMLERAREEAKDEYKAAMEVSDFCAARDMKVYPLYDGDLLDLGDRQIEVVDVGGHSPGSVVFVDRALRIAFTGDACNGNTLLDFGNALPVDTYLKNLLHLKHFQPEFDMCYGGHQVFTSGIIDEGIELAARVLSGSDDREESVGLFGQKVIYAARHGASPIERADGKSFNMSYDPDRRFAGKKQPRVIDFKPTTPF